MIFVTSREVEILVHNCDTLCGKLHCVNIDFKMIFPYSNVPSVLSSSSSAN